MNLLEHRPRLIKIAEKIVHNHSLAEDFADAAIGNAVVNWSQRNTDNLNAWMNSIVKNICFHFLRDFKKHEAHETERERLRQRERTPLQHAISSEILKGVDAALDALTEKQRTVFKFSQIDGLPDEETAKLVGIRPGAVRALNFRARKTLMKKLERFIS